VEGTESGRFIRGRQKTVRHVGKRKPNVCENGKDLDGKGKYVSPQTLLLKNEIKSECRGSGQREDRAVPVSAHRKELHGIRSSRKEKRARVIFRNGNGTDTKSGEKTRHEVLKDHVVAT